MFVSKTTLVHSILGVLGLCAMTEARQVVVADVATLKTALSAAAVGDTIRVHGGTYAMNTQITLATSGTAATRICLFAVAGETPIFDFTTQPYGDAATVTNPRGIQLNASYWHFQGLSVMGAADNGIYVAGSNNIIEGCKTYKNRDTGLQLGRATSSMATMAEWPANNLILNCESYDNYDLAPNGGENADGFACKLTTGQGNVFRGCVAHHNIDDGWDLYSKTATGVIGTVTIDNCIAHHNGTLTTGYANPNGDKNGFKLGGSDMAVRHVVTRSIAYKNGKNGFTWNSNPGALEITNNLAWDNVEGNFNVGDNATPTLAVFANNISFWTSLAADASDKYIGTDVANSNCWWNSSKTPSSINTKGLACSMADLRFTDFENPGITRDSKGYLNMSLFQLAVGSDLLNAGTTPTVTLPFVAASYYNGVPDLGAYETPAVGTSSSSAASSSSATVSSSSKASSSSVALSSSSTKASSSSAAVSSSSKASSSSVAASSSATASSSSVAASSSATASSSSIAAAIRKNSSFPIQFLKTLKQYDLLGRHSRF